MLLEGKSEVKNLFACCVVDTMLGVFMSTLGLCETYLRRRVLRRHSRAQNRICFLISDHSTFKKQPMERKICFGSQFGFSPSRRRGFGGIEPFISQQLGSLEQGSWCSLALSLSSSLSFCPGPTPLE